MHIWESGVSRFLPHLEVLNWWTFVSFCRWAHIQYCRYSRPRSDWQVFCKWASLCLVISSSSVWLTINQLNNVMSENKWHSEWVKKMTILVEGKTHADLHYFQVSASWFAVWQSETCLGLFWTLSGFLFTSLQSLYFRGEGTESEPLCRCICGLGFFCIQLCMRVCSQAMTCFSACDWRAVGWLEWAASPAVCSRLHMLGASSEGQVHPPLVVSHIFTQRMSGRASVQ